MSGFYSFLGTAAAICGVVATQQLLKREPITRSKYNLTPDPDSLPKYETDTKRIANEKQAAAKADSKSAGATATAAAEDTLHYAVALNAARPIKYSKTGIASEPAQTVIETLRRAVKNHPKAVAMKQERGGDGKWVDWTYQQYYDEIMQVLTPTRACGLLCAHSPTFSSLFS